METCKQCAGEGIVGAGDFPIQKQGPLSTCQPCSGTGKVTASETVEETLPSEPETETPVVTEETPVIEPEVVSEPEAVIETTGETPVE